MCVCVCYGGNAICWAAAARRVSLAKATTSKRPLKAVAAAPKLGGVVRGSFVSTFNSRMLFDVCAALSSMVLHNFCASSWAERVLLLLLHWLLCKA